MESFFCGSSGGGGGGVFNGGGGCFSTGAEHHCAYDVCAVAYV